MGLCEIRTLSRFSADIMILKNYIRYLCVVYEATVAVLEQKTKDTRTIAMFDEKQKFT